LLSAFDSATERSAAAGQGVGTTCRLRTAFAAPGPADCLPD
jgi:hypothetical protein